MTEITFHHNCVGTSVYARRDKSDKWKLIDLYQFPFMNVKQAEQVILDALQAVVPDESLVVMTVLDSRSLGE